MQEGEEQDDYGSDGKCGVWSPNYEDKGAFSRQIGVYTLRPLHSTRKFVQGEEED